MSLKSHLGEQHLGVLAAYHQHAVVHYVGIVYPCRDDRLRVFVPKGHRLAVGARVTVHLDNRTGVDAFDAELRVYRASYKGRVIEVEDNWLVLAPLEFMLVHGDAAVETWHADDYAFPADARANRELPVSPLAHLGPIDAGDNENKVGVLTTLAQGQPHTTVLAFLSTEADDVFVVSLPDTFKLHLLAREPRCFFTIDERAKYTFEQAIHWNYTILESTAHRVLPGTPLYEEIRTAFILKSPFESGFFSIEGLEMLHLPRSAVVAAGEMRPLPPGVVEH